jgi:hypothetical protein
VGSDGLLPFQLKECQFVSLDIVDCRVNIRDDAAYITQDNPAFDATPARLRKNVIELLSPPRFPVVGDFEPLSRVLVSQVSQQKQEWIYFQPVCRQDYVVLA